MKSGVFFTAKTVQGAVVEGNRTNRGLFSRSQQQTRHTLLPMRLKRFVFFSNSTLDAVVSRPFTSPAADVSASTADLGNVDLEKKTLQPPDNPFGQKCYQCVRSVLLPMCPGRTMRLVAEDAVTSELFSQPRTGKSTGKIRPSKHYESQVRPGTVHLNTSYS